MLSLLHGAFQVPRVASKPAKPDSFQMLDKF